jgi:recombination protein RecA
MGVELNIVDKSGSWYSFKETRIGQGRENAKEYLKEHPEMTDEIEKMILAANGLSPDNDKAASSDGAASKSR